MNVVGEELKIFLFDVFFLIHSVYLRVVGFPSPPHNSTLPVWNQLESFPPYLQLLPHFSGSIFLYTNLSYYFTSTYSLSQFLPWFRLLHMTPPERHRYRTLLSFLHTKPLKKVLVLFIVRIANYIKHFLLDES